MIKTVIIDDEPGNVVTMSEILRNYCKDISVAGSATDIHSGYSLINEVNPDLVFLDIEMPGGTGFDLLDLFQQPSFAVIFVTAYNGHAIRAFKYAAIDYILKPVNIVELQHAVVRASERLHAKNKDERISRLLENIRQEERAFQKIGLPTMQGIVFEEINEITHLKAEGSYTRIYTAAKNELVSKSMKEFEDILPGSFFRIHHSYIINMNFVKRYIKGRGGYVEMKDGTEIEVAVRKKDGFLARFKS